MPARLGKILLALGLLTGGPAVAQGLDVAKAFTVFDRFCRPAMMGIEPLKAQVRVPGPYGEKVFAVSPDGHYISVQTGFDDFLILAEFRYGPGVVVRSCLVQQIIAQQVDYATTDAAFRQAVPKGPGVVMTGGEVVEDVPGVGAFAMAGAGTVTRPRSVYMIHGATEPAGSFITAMTAQGVFTLTGNAIVPR